MPAMLSTLRHRLEADCARLEFEFPYFLRRAAPVTGTAALMDYQCRLAGEQDDHGTRLGVGVCVPVTSVCPCSKAISDYGAHNQRARITIRACPRAGADGVPALVWADDLIEIAENASSCPVYPLLKRPDERHVTMRAYENPVFVEDMARTAATSLGQHDGIMLFSVEAASEESIHNHSAYARIAPRPADGHAWPGGW
jgi:GTP cyclohydrolase IB